MLGEDSRIVMAGTEPFHTVETARSPATHDERMPNEVQGAVHDTLLMTQLEVVSGEGAPCVHKKRPQQKAAFPKRLQFHKSLFRSIGSSRSVLQLDDNRIERFVTRVLRIMNNGWREERLSRLAVGGLSFPIRHVESG
jgi:hypothetical protein